MSTKRAAIPLVPVVSPQKQSASNKKHKSNSKENLRCIFIGKPTNQMKRIQDMFYRDSTIFDTIVPFNSILPDIKGIGQDVHDEIATFEDLFADTGVLINESNQPAPFHGPLEPAFGNALRNMGIHRLNNWSDFLTLTGARLEPNTSRNTLLFTITPTVDKKVTANVNHNNVPEIWRKPNNTFEYNPRFWRSTIDTTGGNGTKKFALNLALKIPEWANSPTGTTQNSHAMEWMRSSGPGFEDAVQPWVYVPSGVAVLKL